MHESIAVAEADKVGAATVALIDSDGDPDTIDLPIPGNDDSMKVIQIVMAKLADAVLEGRARAPHVVAPEPVPQQAVSVGGRERGGRGRGERLFGFGGPRGGGGGGGGGRGRGPGGPRPAPAAPAAPPQG